MVSFQAPISPDSRKTNIPGLLDYLSRKRKWEDDHHHHHQYHHVHQRHEEISFDNNNRSSSKAAIPSKSPTFDIELHLETPLPSEWERCLDIQSGQIHFYNKRTQKRTSGDPSKSPNDDDDDDHRHHKTEINAPEADDYHHNHMSLDLELNLRCDSQRKTSSNNSNYNQHATDMTKQKKKMNSTSGDHHHQLTRHPPWLAFNVHGDNHDDADDDQEMVATACMRCHMLVMLCKSSPTCPNCKFMHPPEQSSLKLFTKQRQLSLLC